MTSSVVVGAALASAVDSAGSSTLASSRGAARCGPATSGRSRHAPASASSATSTERLMRPLLKVVDGARQQAAKGVPTGRKAEPQAACGEDASARGVAALGSVEGDAQPEVDHVL